MLHELRIQNLVLFEEVTIPFGKGVNILTGETGAGKTAVMSALCLIGGDRADLSLIRNGKEKATVEALFSPPTPEFFHRLDEAGITCNEGEPLLIKREITASGKGKAHINHQPVLVSLLRSLSPYLFEMVTQHANQMLFSTESHRKILDTFGNIHTLHKEFAFCWEQERDLCEEQQRLTEQEAERVRQIDRLTAESEELHEAALREGEEEELFQEYSRLTHADEMAGIVDGLVEELSSGENPVLAVLRRHQQQLDKLSALDRSCEEFKCSYKNALTELAEATYSLERYRSELDPNPGRAAELNTRLTLINRIKRKYGRTITEILEYASEASKKLDALQGVDGRLDQLEKEIAKAKEATNQAASRLSQARLEAANRLGAALTKQIQSLNMGAAEISLSITQTKRTRNGDDHVELMMRPNAGEKEISVKECASGGEISRLLLSIKTLLAGLEATPTLIFDEVDANIGGETATIVGKKLLQIGSEHQLLCITHFPQVAKQANSHLHVYKEEVNGRTVSNVKLLDKQGHQSELDRMSGERKEVFLT